MLWYVTVVQCSVIYLWKMIVVLLSNYQRLQHVCWWLRPAKARRQRTGNGPCRSTKSSILPVGCSHEFDHGLFLNLPSYCWWKISCTSWWVLCSIIFRVLTIQGGAGFLPSTVPWFFLVNIKKSPEMFDNYHHPHEKSLKIPTQTTWRLQHDHIGNFVRGSVMEIWYSHEMRYDNINVKSIAIIVIIMIM